VNSRGRRAVERALSRHIRNAQRQIAEKLRRQAIHDLRLRKIENDQGPSSETACTSTSAESHEKKSWLP